MPRKWAYSVEEGEGVKLVGLGEVFLCREVLKVGGNM